VNLPPEGGPETVTYTFSPVIVTARICDGSPTPVLNVSVAGNTVAIGVHPLSTLGCRPSAYAAVPAGLCRSAVAVTSK
jgi:hypothetical protein